MLAEAQIIIDELNARGYIVGLVYSLLTQNKWCSGVHSWAVQKHTSYMKLEKPIQTDTKNTNSWSFFDEQKSFVVGNPITHLPSD